jgi:SAM-dependent methyltransferase
MEHAAYDEMRALEDHHWWFKSRRRGIAPLIASALERAPGGERPTLLEVGCGTGGNLDFVERRFPRARVVGLDVERRALAHCRDRALAADLVCGDGTRLPLADASVDCVLALDVVEHFEDDRRLLAEFGRVLRPGGQVVASVPRHPSLWSPHDDFMHHKRRYAAGELERKLGEAGFDVPERHGFSLLLLPAIALVRWARRGRSRLVGGQPRTASSDFFALPGPLGWGLEALYGLERGGQRLCPLPWGLSLLVRAEKPAAGPRAEAAPPST